MNRTLKLLIGVLAAGATLAGVAVAASSPAVSTGSAASITTNSAVLNGTVNPNGASTTYRFEWGLTSAYGFSSSNKSAGSGTKAVGVKFTAGQLIPGTVYHYRLDALNRFGGAFGSDRKFRTAGNPPPGAVTGPAIALGSSFATVTGSVNPNNESTSWWVQYGLTPFYGFQTISQSVPAGRTPVLVAAQLQGLQPGVVFHYRVVAQHGANPPQAGADATFMTYPSPRPVPRVLARTRPGRARSAPYVFTTSGHVTRPSWIPPGLSCFQNATVRFFNGRKEVAASLVPILPDCTFSGTTTFNRLPGHGKKNRRVRLKILIHFRGNGYLAPADARAEFVTLG